MFVRTAFCTPPATSGTHATVSLALLVYAKSLLRKHADAQTTNKPIQKTETKQTMNKFILNIALVTVISASFAASTFAASSATQTVTYEVSAINELSVSSPTVSLTVNAASAGSAPTAATNSATSYAITTNEAGRKITGSINSDMPTGVTLAVALAAPSTGFSLGSQSLSTTAVDLVNSIEAVNGSALGISYSLSATSAAGVVPSASKTVTLTITAEA